MSKEIAMNWLKEQSYNVWVFFARIRTKKKLKKLKQDLGDLSWHLGVEKIDNKILLQQYEETKLKIFILEISLKALEY
jgi:hypothetical protein